MSERRGRVLVVDDDPLQVRSLLPILEGEFDVVATSTVAAGLAALARGVDVLIADFDLPDGTGDQIGREVSSKGLRTYTLLVTGHGDDQRVRALAAAGELLVLWKPVDPEDLLQWVRFGVAQARLRVASDRQVGIAT